MREGYPRRDLVGEIYMKVTYIYHSGFLVETAVCYYLFDYYKGDIPRLDIGKPIFVFVSHRHPDHYNPDIFDMLAEKGMKRIIAVLAKDIPEKKRPVALGCEKFDLRVVTFHQTYELPCGTVAETLQSTDRGVAFIVKCSEGTIYHAGDLNEWIMDGQTEQYNRQMTGNFRHEIDILSPTAVDIAFHPLDPRLGDYYDRGLLYLLQKVKIGRVYPMHYWEHPQIIDRFREEHPEYREKISSATHK